MKCVLFYHAFTSCWNNGNAHFLRGVARELGGLGHDVVVYEPADGWSRVNAIRDGGEQILSEVPPLFPGVVVRSYGASFDLDEALDGADLVIVHEWNSPQLVANIGARRAQGAPFTLFFHDTHHRAVTAPHELGRFDLDGFDGVLAFGEVLRQIYLKLGWANRAFTWHEAADTALYRPMPHIHPTDDLVWIGNWGDEERSAELHDFLIEPVGRLKLAADIYGVRYPQEAQRLLRSQGIFYGGWLPNHRAPDVFARARATVHVPRRPYVRALPGIPTIRVFEALACGIPLVCAPWEDCEQLFPSGAFLRTQTGAQMTEALADVLNDDELADELAETGLRAIEAAHTCAHRANELVAIVERLGPPRTAAPPHSAELQVAS